MFFARKDIRKGVYKQTGAAEKLLQGESLFFRSGIGEGREGYGRRSKVMSGGEPVFVLEMYSPRACMRLSSVQSVASYPREETSFSKRFLAPDWEG